MPKTTKAKKKVSKSKTKVAVKPKTTAVKSNSKQFFVSCLSRWNL